VKPDEPVKIAMLGFSNNPYWVSVEAGADTANDVLAGYSGSVDWITAGATIDVQTVNNAINAAAAQGYDGIGFFIAGEGNCDTVAQLTETGVSLGAYNTLFDCLADAGAVVNYAQEQTEAGRMAAEELIKKTDGKAGTVGIITSSFTAPGAEQRRQGFIDGLEGSNLTVIGEGVEAHDSASETYTAAQNYIQSSPDLVGIYATAGGPFGAAQAVAAAGAADTVNVIGYDLSDENMAAIEDGSMYGAIGQDAFGQGYNVAIELYNAIVTGEKPAPGDVLQPADSPFVTKETIAEHDASKLPLGTLGTS
jgi:ribose transport system substrate-binding protein